MHFIDIKRLFTFGGFRGFSFFFWFGLFLLWIFSGGMLINIVLPGLRGVKFSICFTKILHPGFRFLGGRASYAPVYLSSPYSWWRSNNGCQYIPEENIHICTGGYLNSRLTKCLLDKLSVSFTEAERLNPLVATPTLMTPKYNFHM